MKNLSNKNVMNALIKYLNATNRARLRAVSKNVKKAVNSNAGYTTPRHTSPARSPPRAPKKRRLSNA